MSNSLVSGRAYTLENLFSGNNKIIIPDLQRDYCWGTKNKEGKELVGDFVRNLIENGFKKGSEELNLGLIYGYEAPDEHIQLCDGQQRITTLFLLLGMINRYCEGDVFQSKLISEAEQEDDKEPYLLYAIRESSLYFLSDLVMHFFLSSEASDASKMEVDAIKNQSWYFNDYDLDPSIQSMLSAMKTMEVELKKLEKVSEFGKFLRTKLSFIYYDMGNRKQGEETFVLINTTGEPLSATEHLKPKLIKAQDPGKQSSCSMQWEQWETFFWGHRKGAGHRMNDTADRGLNEFFRWVMLMEASGDTLKMIQQSGDYQFDCTMDFGCIQRYFEITQQLFQEGGLFCSNLDWLSPDKMNAQIVWFQLLPVMVYIKRFSVKEASVEQFMENHSRSVLRVKTFFENLARIENVSKAVGELLAKAMELVKQLPNMDVASICGMENVSREILTDEEKMKFSIYNSLNECSTPKREDIEDFFWEAERHPIFRGEIAPLLAWSKNKTGVFDFETCKVIYAVFELLFYGDLEYKELDLTRRALLTRGLNEYPRIFRGYTNYSFCWEYTDWQRLIKDNVEKFGAFLKELVGKEIVAKQKEMIAEFLKTSASCAKPDDNVIAFLKRSELLAYCNQKNVQWLEDKATWLLIENQKASGAHANLKSYLLYLDLSKASPNGIFKEKWKLDFSSYEQSCVYFDWAEKGIAIDVFHTGKDEYALQLFKREGESKECLEEVALNCDLTFHDECGRYESGPKSREEIIRFIQEVMTKVEGI